MIGLFRCVREIRAEPVKAYLVKKDYPNGMKVTDEQMEQLRIKAHATQPARNYTLKPR